jgi:WhiB family redox-sensing transcriptional regulator
MATSKMIEQACRPDSAFGASPQLLKGADATLHGAEIALPQAVLDSALETLGVAFAVRHDCDARKARPATEDHPARPARPCTRPGHAQDAAGLRLMADALDLLPHPSEPAQEEPEPVEPTPIRPRAAFLLAWMNRAACRGEDLVLFFGPDGERQPERDIREAKAKAICDRCPVRDQCLDYAVGRPEKYGLWAGLGEDERASERRRRMRRAAAIDRAIAANPDLDVADSTVVAS